MEVALCVHFIDKAKKCEYHHKRFESFFCPGKGTLSAQEKINLVMHSINIIIRYFFDLFREQMLSPKEVKHNGKFI
ncbi:hypothetical protein X809_11395 [Paenibacillus polymyxa CR1]|nr:hypothetical protein X809_11395 [Paenibacillus polymyxa CR1]